MKIELSYSVLKRKCLTGQYYIHALERRRHIDLNSLLFDNNSFLYALKILDSDRL